jgi:hypothetical protein
MAELVYALCAATSILCALLLFRGYRASRTKLLFIDLILLPQINLFAWRSVAALSGMSLLLYGLVWESK